jgi:DNA polymerase-3 subunit alpha
MEDNMNKIDFVGLHAHSGVGSPFDGFGYPQDHMDYAYNNGSRALALTDHGNMNGLAYQVLHAKRMKKEGKDFKPIFGVEAYFIESVADWKVKLEEHRADKDKSKNIDDARSGTTVENEAESKSATKSELNRKRHIVLLAMNQTGLNNIFKLVSESYHGDNFYRKPRIDFAMLEKHNEGIIALSACLGGIYAGCYWENHEQGPRAVKQAMRDMTVKMLDIFGDRWYGELQWNSVPEQHQLNRYVIQMHKEFGIPLVSTCDSHYPSPDAWNDRELYKKIGWLGKGKPEWMSDELPESVDEIGYELYPKNGEQMWSDYKRYSNAIHTDVSYDDDVVRRSILETVNIAFERIDDFLPDNTVRLPDFVVPAGHHPAEYLAQLSFEGLFKILELRSVRRGSTTWVDYTKRLKHELEVISDRGFSKYFLTMKSITDKTNEVQLAGPGRGSAAGSLVAYALGITQVDPIKYGLLFSRFLRADATDYPDIDYDVSDPMVLKELLIEEWGSNTVVPISNFNTLQLKSLIKDISKFYDIPFTEVNVVTNTMLKEATPLAKKKHGIRAGVYTPTFEEVCEFSETLQKFFIKHPKVKSHVEGLMGQVRSTSRHAGGVVIGADLDKYMPLIASKGVRQTPWSEGQNVRQLEPMGFIKFDILGLATLRMMEEAIERILQNHHGVENPTFEDIKRYYDENLHPDVINLDDKEVYENIFQAGKWMGIFQFTEKGAQSLAKRAQPKSIIDISAITSIYRPGPLSAGVDKAYVEAVNDPSSIRYENEIVEELTTETRGFLIFQEQIALLANRLGKNISLDDANLLRKLLTKKGLDASKQAKKEEILHKFVEGCIEKGMSKRAAEDMWQKFEYFSGYGFNKSHAVAYSMISYQTAWLATYYNAEWACAFLDKEPESRKEAAINIAKSWGYTIKPLDINTSGRRWTAQDDTTLVAPLTTIKGLGDAAIDEIIEKRPFTSVEHLLFDGGVVARKLNKKSLDALCRASAMNDLIDDRFYGDKHFWSAVVVDKPKNKKKLNENIEAYREEGSFSTAERIQNTQTLTGIYPINMVMTQRSKSILDSYKIPPLSEYDPDLGCAWCIPIKISSKKSKNGKWFYTIDVIDSNSEVTRIRCWGVDPQRDTIYMNKPYVLKYPKYNETWGFSTYGRVDKKWMMIG